MRNRSRKNIAGHSLFETLVMMFLLALTGTTLAASFFGVARHKTHKAATVDAEQAAIIVLDEVRSTVFASELNESTTKTVEVDGREFEVAVTIQKADDCEDSKVREVAFEVEWNGSNGSKTLKTEKWVSLAQAI